MNRILFKIKEKLFKTGPMLGHFVFNYRAGVFLLNKLIKLRIFQEFRATEIEKFSNLLEILNVPKSQHKPIIEQYLFNNTWHGWKSLHFEKPETFSKYWLIENKNALNNFYLNQKVIIFLYRHTPLSSENFSLLRFGFNFKFVGLGNINHKKYALLNGQTDLPKYVMNNPIKYKQLIRRDQLKKILFVLDKPEGYAINYFFDGQEGNNFRKGRIGGLHYRLSEDLCRFLRPHTQLVLVEPRFNFDGSVNIQFHEVPCLADFTEQLDYVQQYYESSFLAALPTLNYYMITQILTNHHALKNSN